MIDFIVATSHDLVSSTLTFSFFPLVTAPISTAFCVVLALVLDRMFGEPSSFHPIIGLGKLVSLIERLLYTSDQQLFLRGAVGAALVHSVSLLLVLCFMLAIGVVAVALAGSELVFSVNASAGDWLSAVVFLLSGFVLYIAIAPRSLVEHIHSVYVPLAAKDLSSAQTALSMVVSRETNSLTEQEIARAAIESLTENENDGVIAPIFWFVCFGPLGLVCFKVANTLDSRWGYRCSRYNLFGRFSARLDDVLGYFPARITAFMLSFRRGVFWQSLTQGRTWYSPNAGPVMAAGALALGVRLGGGAYYNGSYKQRPTLGCARNPSVKDLALAITMIKNLHLMLLWIFLILGLCGLATYVQDLL